jgi:hypothetical protein
MIGAQILTLWMWKFFPSQDGPSHLYNVTVLFNFSKVPLYRDYFKIEFSPIGNMLTDLLLGNLMRLFSPLIAEKILISIYLILFPVALRILLTALAPEVALGFSFFAFALSYNFFLHMGFWNFCLSVPLALLTLWMVVRPAKPVTRISISALFLLAFATYLAHLVAWGILALATGWILWCEQRGWPATKTLRRPLDRVWTFAAVVAPTVLAALFVAHQPHRFGFPRMSLAAKAQLLYKLRFLMGYGGSETMLQRTLFVVFLIALAALAARSFACRSRFWNPFLALAGLCIFMAVFGPARYGNGRNIRERAELFGILFLVAGLAVSGWPQKVNPILAVCLSALSLLAIWNRRSAYDYWNTRLGEYAALEQRIEPNSTVLPLVFEESQIHPTLHAIRYWSPKPFIDVSDYEAASKDFIVRFRPGKSLTQDNLWSSDGPSLIAGYLRRLVQLRPAVDYVLVDQEYRHFDGWKEAENFSGILSEFRLEYASPPPGNLRLYRNLHRSGTAASVRRDGARLPN